jgi:hypothetical protein
MDMLVSVAGDLRNAVNITYKGGLGVYIKIEIA